MFLLIFFILSRLLFILFLINFVHFSHAYFSCSLSFSLLLLLLLLTVFLSLFVLFHHVLLQHASQKRHQNAILLYWKNRAGLSQVHKHAIFYGKIWLYATEHKQDFWKASFSRFEQQNFMHRIPELAEVTSETNKEPQTPIVVGQNWRG